MTTNKTQKPNVIEELEGQMFTYGEKDTIDTYVKTKKAIADYVNMTYGKEMWTLVSELTEAAPEEPEAPSSKDSSKQRIYENKMKRFWELEDRYKERKNKVFRLIMLQCTLPLKNKLQQLAGFKVREGNDDVIWLLGRVKDLAYGVTEKQNEYWVLQDVMRRGFMMRQFAHESLEDFYDRFVAHHEMVEELWGVLCPPKKGNLTGIEQKVEQDKFKACIFLAGVNRDNHWPVIEDLKNDCIAGRDSYPANVEDMMELLSFRMRKSGKGKKGKASSNENGRNDGRPQVESSFVQRRTSQLVCHCCGESGHLARDCPQKGRIPEDQWFIRRAQRWNNGSSNASLASTASGTRSSDNSVVSQRGGFTGLQF